MTRRRALRVVQDDAVLRPRLQQRKAKHPCWGSRRLWASRRVVDHLPVHRKRVLRLMREQPLLVPPPLRLKAKRTPTGGKPTPTRPTAWGGIEMTKVLRAGFGWLSIGLVLDWYPKKSVGHDAGWRGTTRHWLAALETAVHRQFPSGLRAPGVSLMRDNGCQPPSLAFMQHCATLEIPPACPSDNNPQATRSPSASCAPFKKSAWGSRSGGGL